MEAKKTQKAALYGHPPEFDKVAALRDDVDEDDVAQIQHTRYVQLHLVKE